MKRIIGILMVIVLVVAFVGCGDSNNTKNNEVEVNNLSSNQEANDTNESSTDEVVGNYPLTFVDSMEREVTIESEPQTVISLAPSVTETIFALGLGDKLVGRTDYCNYPLEALEVDSIGTLLDPNIEAIIALNPDLIIASSFFSEEVLAKLEEADLKVVILIAQESFDGVYDNIIQAGSIFDVKEKANEVVANMKSDVADTLSILDGAEKKTVYYVVGFGEYGDYTATGDTFIHDMLEMAGGSNIAADGVGWSYNLETIIEKDPEYIICSINWDTKSTIEATEGYMELTAVKEGKLVEIDQDLLSRQGPRLAEGLRAIAKLLHPDLFN